MNKVWYQIDVECIEYGTGCTMNVGDMETIARVKSYGVAYAVAGKLAEIYTPRFFKVTIK